MTATAQAENAESNALQAEHQNRHIIFTVPRILGGLNDSPSLKRKDWLGCIEKKEHKWQGRKRKMTTTEPPVAQEQQKEG